jgi:hypothetical protein
MSVRNQAPGGRALVLTNVILVLLPLVVVGALVATGLQPASRARSILLFVFGVEAAILLLPSSWIRTGGVRPYGGMLNADEFKAFMQENRAMAQNRAWGTELAAIGPGLAFVALALSFLLVR